MKYTPENITKLEPHQVFVMGANEAGRHGKGAAKQALKWGAVYGIGIGHQGQTYAIPTKDKNLKVLSLYKIQKYVEDFLHYAKSMPELEFLVTEIGTGLAGYSPKDIAPFFKIVPENVILPKSFQDEIDKLTTS
jgi:hypothetical protein